MLFKKQIIMFQFAALFVLPVGLEAKVMLGRTVNECSQLLVNTQAPAHPLVAAILNDAFVLRVKLENLNHAATQQDEITLNDKYEKLKKAMPKADPSIVFYPLAYTDITAPLQIFPNAEVYVLTDQQSFFGSSGNFDLRTHAQYSTLWWKGHSEDRTLIEFHIGGLLTVLPDTRIRRVLAFHYPEQMRWWTRDRRRSRPLQQIKLENLSPMHALVEFDQGPGTPVKYLVYFKERLPSFDLGGAPPRTQKHMPHFLSFLDRHPPEAVIIKGGLNAFGPPEFADMNGFGIRDSVIGWLTQNQGLIVKDSTPFLLRPGMGSLSEIPLPFGYDTEKTQIIQF